MVGRIITILLLLQLLVDISLLYPYVTRGRVATSRCPNGWFDQEVFTALAADSLKMTALLVAKAIGAYGSEVGFSVGRRGECSQYHSLIE